MMPPVPDPSLAALLADRGGRGGTACASERRLAQVLIVGASIVVIAIWLLAALAR